MLKFFIIYSISLTHWSILLLIITIFSTLFKFYILSFFPNPNHDLSILIRKLSLPMLLIVQPPPIINSAIWPGESTRTTFLVILILPFIRSTIWIGQQAFTMHLILRIVTNVLGAVTPVVMTLSIELIILPVTLIKGVVWKLQHTIAISLTVTEVTFIQRPIF